MREEWTACLARMAESRDRALFAQLFEHFAPRIKSYLMRQGASPAQADELAQEAMLSVWRKAHLFNPAKANASTWMFTLARNLFIDRLRREKAPCYELPTELPDADDRDAGEGAVISDRMLACIRKLPEAQAQVLYMSYYDGRSHSEIAEVLGIPLGSVKSRLRLAFDKLKLMWGESS
ncbi:MAG: sigma-70 family RNA polymerase sigma factor [Oceanospirillaceae bacterium]|nr:sigma-70 family RNA polymerase sigma factor [Oceanospirillaceae bacterium]